MKLLIKSWIFGCLAGLASIAIALPRDVDLKDFNAIHPYTYSEPLKASTWASAAITTLDAKKDPIAWMHAYWILSIAAEYTYDRTLIDAYDKEEKRLPEAIQIAKDLGRIPEYLQLRAIKISHEHDRQPSSITAIEALLAEPEAIHSQGADAFLYAEIAWTYYSLDHFQESFKALEKAFKLIESNPSMLSSDRTRLLNDIGLLMAASGQVQRGINVMLEASKACDQEVLYFLCGVISYNLGEQYLNLGDASLAQGVEFFKKSITLAEQSGDRATLGSAYCGLADSAFKTGDFKRAIEQATLSIEHLKTTSDLKWITKSYISRVDPLLSLGRWAEAEADIKQAEQSADSTPHLQDMINLRKAKLYAGLGQWEKSSSLWPKVYESTKKSYKDRDQKKLAQATAAVGLVAEEQKSLRLEVEVKRQDGELQARHRQLMLILGILAFACLGLLSAMFSLHKSREIRRSREKLQRILDNIDEGLLTIDPTLHVESDFSPAMRHLLPPGIRPDGLHFIDDILCHARLSESEQSQLQAGLSSILGEDSIAWDLNHANLPREVLWQTQDGERTVTIDWSPIYGDTPKIHALLVSLRDVTERRQLEEELHSQKIHSQQLLTRMMELQQSPRALVSSFLQKAHAALQLPPADNWKRMLHTMKGEARGLGLKTLSHLIHDSEAKMPSNALRSVLHRELQDYENLIQGASVPVESGNLLDLVSQRLPDIQKILAEHRLRLDSIIVDDAFHAWTPDLLNNLRPILLHALTNAIDHGYVRATDPREVCLHIEARAVAQVLLLTIRDQGQGLNWPRIRELAEKAGFTPGPQQTLADCLFLEGLSTAASLSETSGRGVGLSVIASLCHEAGGSVFIRDNDRGPGTLLAVHWPIETRPALMRSA